MSEYITDLTQSLGKLISDVIDGHAEKTGEKIAFILIMQPVAGDNKTTPGGRLISNLTEKGVSRVLTDVIKNRPPWERPN